MLKDMKAYAHLNPGQKGTMRLQEKYGDKLLCVRNRYDIKKRKQYKTVEIIVSEKDWTPPPAKFPESEIVALKISASDKKLQSDVKALGGRWNPERKVWLLPYRCMYGTKLDKFVIVQNKENVNTEEVCNNTNINK